MSLFYLSITAEKHLESATTRFGTIQIGDFKENFEIDLSFWSLDQYVDHWKQSLARLIEGETKSCLLTSLSDPAEANFFYWWPMYREGNKIFVQNGVLFLDEAKDSFTPENPYQSIPERETISEDGELISEWEISVNTLRDYLLHSV